jgi:hypothetical protein
MIGDGNVGISRSVRAFQAAVERGLRASKGLEDHRLTVICGVIALGRHVPDRVQGGGPFGSSPQTGVLPRALALRAE